MQQSFVPKLEKSISQWAIDTFRFIQEDDQSIKVHTEYLDLFNENLTFYIEIDGSEYIITDDGQTCWNFKTHSLPIRQNGTYPKKLLSMIQSEGVELTDDEQLILLSTEEDLMESIITMFRVLLMIHDYAKDEKQ